MDYVAFGCRTLIGLVFLVAAGTKFRDFGGFTESVRRLAPILSRYVKPMARLVIGFETGIVALLVTPWTDGWCAGLAVALGLDALFTIAIVLALRRGDTEPCHCFGSSTSRPLSAVDVVRDIALAVVASAGLASAAMMPASAGQLRTGGSLLAGVAGALGAALLILLDDMVGLFVSGPTAWGPPVEEASPWHI